MKEIAEKTDRGCDGINLPKGSLCKHCKVAKCFLQGTQHCKNSASYASSKTPLVRQKIPSRDPDSMYAVNPRSQFRELIHIGRMLNLWRNPSENPNTRYTENPYKKCLLWDGKLSHLQCIHYKKVVIKFILFTFIQKLIIWYCIF